MWRSVFLSIFGVPKARYWHDFRARLQNPWDPAVKPRDDSSLGMVLLFWNASLEDQLKRAVASTALNISEGNGRRGLKDRARFFDIARASAAESASVIDVAVAFGIMEKTRGDEMQGKLLEIVKMLYKLK